MEVGLKTGVDLETGEVVSDSKEQVFKEEYFKVAEMIRRRKDELKGLKHTLEEIYVMYRKYQAEKKQGKLFQ